MSASSYDVTVNVSSGVQAITVDFNTTPTNITIQEISRDIEIIEVESSFSNLVYSVNDLQGVISLTHSASLGSATPVSGLYTYTASHNLNYQYPLVMVYNNNGQLVAPEIELVDSNVIRIKSLVDLNSYRVVVQR